MVLVSSTALLQVLHITEFAVSVPVCDILRKTPGHQDDCYQDDCYQDDCYQDDCYQDVPGPRQRDDNLHWM